MADEEMTTKPCFYCGIPTYKHKPKKGHPQPHCKRSRDHLIPKVRGGKSVPENIVISCERCNQDKGQLTYDEYQVVLRFRRGEISLNAK